VSGHYAYIAASDLLIFDVSNTAEPVLVGAIESLSGPGGMVLAHHRCHLRQLMPM